jgi:glycerophosphoryl diester phosphodiesterase
MRKILATLLLGFAGIQISQSQTLRQLLTDHAQIVCSHRAAIEPNVTENSIQSMQEALEGGIYMHEIDVRESEDGELYILHDETLDRTTHAKGQLNTYTSEELEEVHLLGNGEKLPRFEDALRFAAAHDIYLMLDVKKAPLQKVMDKVADYGLLDKVVVLTFSEARAKEAFALDHKFLVSVLVNEIEDLLNYKQLSSHVLAYINQGAPIALFQEVRRNNTAIITDTLNAIDQKYLQEGPSVLQEFQEKRKANIIVSDYPLVFLNF